MAIFCFINVLPITASDYLTTVIPSEENEAIMTSERFQHDTDKPMTSSDSFAFQDQMYKNGPSKRVRDFIGK